jgi:hypothetical protein
MEDVVIVEMEDWIFLMVRFVTRILVIIARMIVSHVKKDTSQLEMSGELVLLVETVYLRLERSAIQE